MCIEIRGIRLDNINEVLKKLYSAYYRDLVAYCIAIGLTNAESEDCAEEAYVRFWLNISTLKDIDDSKQRIWLYKACLNIMHETIRSRDKTNHTNIKEIEDTHPDTQSKIDEIVELDAYYKKIEEVREELLSTYLEYKVFTIMINGELDMGYKALSEKYGINASTLRSQVRRLRLKLMNLL